MKPVTLEDVAREEELVEKLRSGNVSVSTGRGGIPDKGAALRAFNVFVGDEYYNVEVEEVGGKTRARAAGNTAPIVMKDGGRRKKKEKRNKDQCREGQRLRRHRGWIGVYTDGSHARHGHKLRSEAKATVSEREMSSSFLRR